MIIGNTSATYVKKKGGRFRIGIWYVVFHLRCYRLGNAPLLCGLQRKKIWMS